MTDKQAYFYAKRLIPLGLWKRQITEKMLKEGYQEDDVEKVLRIMKTLGWLKTVG